MIESISSGQKKASYQLLQLSKWAARILIIFLIIHSTAVSLTACTKESVQTRYPAGNTDTDNDDNNTAGSVYYFDGTNGKDGSNGLSPENAWKSLSKISSLKLEPGSKILLKCGSVFENQYIELNGQRGTEDEPLEISTYGSGEKPVVSPGNTGKSAVIITACEFIEIDNIEMKGGTGGIFFTWVNSATQYRHFVFRNLYIHDIYASNGSGFQLNLVPKESTKMSEYNDVLIEDCRAEMIVRSFVLGDCLNDMKIINNKFSYSGGPGIRIGKSNNLLIRGNHINSSGSRAHESFNGRGSCGWVLGCRNVLVEKNLFENAGGWLDSYGFHLDIGNSNVVVQHNLSRNNAGGFVQILGKNKNCCYRYNISVNDGWRVKGMFDNPAEKNIEDGCVVSLNGYVANGNFEGPYNTYIYNNTIYVKDDIKAGFNFRYTINGVYIANNIFHITGNSHDITGKYKDREPESLPQNIVFKNNIYLKNENLPSGMLIDDALKITGDAGFKNAGGTEADDYAPGNRGLITDKSIPVEKIPGDATGITIGFTVEKDFLGNPITGTPDIGAIEIINKSGKPGK